MSYLYVKWNRFGVVLPTRGLSKHGFRLTGHTRNKGLLRGGGTFRPQRREWPVTTMSSNATLC